VSSRLAPLGSADERRGAARAGLAPVACMLGTVAALFLFAAARRRPNGSNAWSRGDGTAGTGGRRDARHL
jgi:hypothetical protein